MKYIAWIQERYATGYKPHEFTTAAELANAILNNDLPKGEMVIARRMTLTVTDAEEAVAKVPAMPEPVPATPAPPMAPEAEAARDAEILSEVQF